MDPHASKGCSYRAPTSQNDALSKKPHILAEIAIIGLGNPWSPTTNKTQIEKLCFGKHCNVEQVRGSGNMFKKKVLLLVFVKLKTGEAGCVLVAGKLGGRAPKTCVSRHCSGSRFRRLGTRGANSLPLFFKNTKECTYNEID